MMFLIRNFVGLSLLFLAGCESTLRDDRRTYGVPAPLKGVGGAISSSNADSASGAGGFNGVGGEGGAGTGGSSIEPACPEVDRLCAVALSYPAGAEGSVELRGNFAPDGWSNGIPMNIGAGSWVATLTAPWGIDIQYKFVINGNTWIHDPMNPNKVSDGFDGYNSVLEATHCEAFLCPPKPALRFAVIGDYGGDALSASAGMNEGAVAALVRSWEPDLVVTVGDNNYPVGAEATIDQNIGKYYQEFIYPYKGMYGPGAAVNRFFPVLGNHDWYTQGAAPYLDYFELPGNERYWEWGEGPVRFFGLDSDPKEPDGTTPDSVQGQWLQGALDAASEPIKIVLMHHPPYSSGAHGPSVWMQWPYKSWGATAVMAGHEHSYERLSVDGLTHIIAGLGGASIYAFNPPVSGSQIRFTGLYGAVIAEVPPGGASMNVRMITTTGLLVDNAVITP